MPIGIREDIFSNHEPQSLTVGTQIEIFYDDGFNVEYLNRWNCNVKMS